MADYLFADNYRLEEGPTRDFLRVFMKGLVHKHNNTLGVIQGFSTLILYEDDLAESVRENAQQMNDTARESNALNQILLTASGCCNFEIKPTALSSMLPYFAEKVKTMCEQKGVTITGNDASGLPDFPADSAKLGEMLMALLTNAAEAAAETDAKTVSFEMYPPGEQSQNGTVDLFIRNSSPDWSQEKIVEYLKPFETSRTNDHFGLGLTMAAVLAGEMGIRMGIKNENGQTDIWLAIPTA